MGTRGIRGLFWRWLMPMLMVGVLFPGAVMAQQTSTAEPATLARVSVARLDADPAPAAVTSGALDSDFVPVAGGRIHESAAHPTWWRITADRRVDAGKQPKLLLHSPAHSAVEAWLPGRGEAITVALIGSNADLEFSSRALVIPLSEGLAAGAPVYLRLDSRGLAPMTVSIESLRSAHRADLTHVAWRSALLGGLGLLALLAFGFWIGIGERSYGYLTLNLLAQAGFFATKGGDVRMVPWLADLIGTNWQLPQLFVLVAAIASLAFLTVYLDLRARQPRLLNVLVVCCVLFGFFNLSALVVSARWVAVAANLTLMFATAVVLAAAVYGCLQRQRAAYFVLLSWLPMMSLLMVRVGEVIGIWTGPVWMDYAFPATFVLSGLIIMIGLSDTLQQLRRDRDRASRLASFDVLTGAMSRPAIEGRLKACVDDSHLGGLPLSVVFFDVDRFKRINDEYGHGVGDSCLKIIALRTRNRLRTYDSLGRWGGDELLVVLPDTHLDEAIGVAENLRSAVNCRPLSIDGNLFEATLSLGVAELAEGETAAQLLDRVDAALYASKAAGRDRVSGRFASSGIRLTGEHAIVGRSEGVTVAAD